MMSWLNVCMRWRKNVMPSVLQGQRQQGGQHRERSKQSCLLCAFMRQQEEVWRGCNEAQSLSCAQLRSLGVRMQR